MYKALIKRVVQGIQFYDTPAGEENLHHASVEEATTHLLESHGVVPNHGQGMVTDVQGQCMVVV